MRKWRRVACGSTPRMLFGPSASSSLTMWHMKAGQHKRLPGVGIWVASENYVVPYHTLQKLMYLVKYLSVLLGLLFPPAYMYTDTVFWMTI